MKNVTFRQLRVFTEVARRLSFVRAAEALHLTPPAVTMQVKELEAGVGLPLFDRRGRTVSLTITGEYFLVYARRLLATLKDAEDAMARLRRIETGVLNVGLVSTAKYFVPRLLARFCEEHPGVEVRLHVAGNRERLVALLHANEIDLAALFRQGEARVLPDIKATVGAQSGAIAGTVASIVGTLAIILVLSIFIVSDASGLQAKWRRVMPNRFETQLDLFDEVDRRLPIMAISSIHL